MALYSKFLKSLRRFAPALAAGVLLVIVAGADSKEQGFLGKICRWCAYCL
jgi:hypothetical protein